MSHASPSHGSGANQRPHHPWETCSIPTAHATSHDIHVTGTHEKVLLQRSLGWSRINRQNVNSFFCYAWPASGMVSATERRGEFTVPLSACSFVMYGDGSYDEGVSLVYFRILCRHAVLSYIFPRSKFQFRTLPLCLTAIVACVCRLIFTRQWTSLGSNSESVSPSQFQPIDNLYNRQFQPIDNLYNRQLQPIDNLYNRQLQPIDNLYNRQLQPIDNLYNRQLQPIDNLYNRQLQPIDNLYNRQLQPLDNLYNRQLQPLDNLYNRQLQPLDNLYNRQLQPIDSLYNRQLQPIDSLYNRQLQPLDSLYNRQLQPLDSLYNRQLQPLDSLYNRQLQPLDIRQNGAQFTTDQMEWQNTVSEDEKRKMTCRPSGQTEGANEIFTTVSEEKKMTGTRTCGKPHVTMDMLPNGISENMTSEVTESPNVMGNMTSSPGTWMVTTTLEFRRATAGIAVFGLIGNTLAIFVLCHRRMWCSTAYLLVILALYDDVILIIHIYRVFDNSPLTLGLLVFQTIAFGPLNWTATTGTIYMTLMVTVERFVAVTSPLRSRIIFSLRAARWISLFVFLGSVVYNLPHWFAFIYNPTKVSQQPLSDFGRTASYHIVYKRYLQLTLMYVLPWATMVVLNIMLLRAVQGRGKRAFREASGRKAIKDLGSRLTLPVIAVTFVFFFAYPFPAIEDSLCFEFQCNRRLFLIFKLVSEIAKVFNSTANFLFYCFLGRRFRKTFFHMTLSWRSRLSRVVTSKSDFRYSTADGSNVHLKLENRSNTHNNLSGQDSDA
ncbi:hypothetical protein BaRGS_00033929 [Batillaria attramentaria]|uniref:G-protein coupled receptors family 1 profile domain-containing protein n=1 Tax=Batillaria attramentaria TaxID=370345 RepID=A0ABD0JK64_9CAEN